MDSTSLFALSSFIGGIVLLAFTFVGAYVWMRWGFCGVAFFFSRRTVLDAIVREDVQKVTGPYA